MVAPVLHRCGGQLGHFCKQRVQAKQVAVVENLSPLDFELELEPAGEPVLACHSQLGGGQDEPVRYRQDRVSAPLSPILASRNRSFGLVAQLAEVGPWGKVGHDVSFQRPAARAPDLIC